MLGPVLALASAIVYGVVDFAGGILSRRVHYAIVAWIGQVGGLVFALAAALAVPAENVGFDDISWGALSGVGSAITMLFLNRARHVPLHRGVGVIGKTVGQGSPHIIAHHMASNSRSLRSAKRSHADIR